MSHLHTHDLRLWEEISAVGLALLFLRFAGRDLRQAIGRRRNNDPDLDSLVLTVDGMTCRGCVGRLEGELRQLEGFESVDVDLDSNRTEIRGRGLDDGAVRAAIAKAGFEAR
jgi:copper chaperone CopZ